jgi:MFS family permease
MSIVRALSNSNYRYYFGGQILSIIGNWMQQIALAWLVYRLTDSTFMLGVVTFAGAIPNLFLAPVGGVLSDRYPRRKLLMITTVLSAVQASLLAFLTFEGLLTPIGIVGMALLLGTINGIDQPIRQAFVPELVERREDIANAVALTSFTIHSSRFIGPMIGGLVVAQFGEAICFALNAVSYGGTLLALSAMTTRVVTPVRHSVADALRQGIAYVRDHQAIRLLLGIVATMALFSGSYQTLLPYFARNVYHGDVRAFGFMTAAGGLGACLGTVFLAARRDVEGMERRIVICAIIVSAALAIFAVTRTFPIAIGAMVVMGFCSINTVAASNALIQSLVENHMRGRVMAIFSMAFFGLSPVGNLLVGSVANLIGVQATLLCCAALVMIMALLALRRHAAIDFSLPAPGL